MKHEAKQKQYTPEFKREAVALVIKQGHGYAEAARLLNINVSVLRRWEKERRLREIPRITFLFRL